MLAARSDADAHSKLPSLRRFLTLEIAVHGARLILAELALASGGYALAGLWFLGRAAELRPTLSHDVALGSGSFFLGVALNELALLVHALLIVAQRRRRGRATLEQPGGQQALLLLALLSLLPLAMPLLISREERRRAARPAARLIGRGDKATTLQEVPGAPGAGSC
ncbi:MAG: hypothetical protein IMW90_11940 [Thermogemmatispora sp.]|jgi:hypothetical protein|uniref:hypothetical protein n=1 Tax=Thermogemmatispora sp. TaxID=1968838 RepID=UPI0019FE4B54|nr:hypothetical protein [Thermogemmatispora sp.]MBE3566426.1 hypothetical protein [Thermogemmatispora sp.]